MATPPTNPNDIEPVERLADAAVLWATAAIYHRHAAALQMRGAQGRRHTEQDLRDHVEFLVAALAVDTPAFFTEYVRWLATVLESRGVPVQMLDESLELLAGFYVGMLDVPLAVRVADILELGRRALAEERSSGPVTDGGLLPDPLPQAEALAHSLVAGDAGAARSLAAACWESCGEYVEVATRLFQPALYRVGTSWQCNEITVAQEHLATSISQTLLTQLFLQARQATAGSSGAGRSAVFAGIEANRHALGIRMVGDAFELAGWSVQMLGADTPIAALVAHVDATRPDLVGLSVSMVQQLPALQRAFGTIRSELGTRRPLLLVGGLPTNQFEDVWRWVGADAWGPDAAHAVGEMA